VTGGLVRPGSLRLRLVWSFLAVVAVVALVTGVTTLSLVRRVSERDVERRLAAQAGAIGDAGEARDRGPGLQLQLCQTRNALRASGTELYVASGGALGVPACRRPGQSSAPAPRLDLSAVLAGGQVTTGTSDGLAWAAAPLPGSGIDGVVLVREVGNLGTGLVGLLGGRLLLGTLLGVAVALAAAWLLSGRLARPLSRVAVAARQLGAGRLDTRVEVSGDDEVAQVAAAFNDMAASLERNQAEQQAFLASVGHELRTPLTVVQGNAEALLDGTADDEAARRRSLERLHAEALRLGRLVQDLLDLGRLGRGQFTVSPADADAAEVLADAAEAVGQGAGAERGVPVELRVPERLPARIDQGRLRQVLDNLLDNAVRSNPPDHSVLVAARTLDDGRAEVVVADQGPGIAAEDLPLAFERGYLWSRYRGTRTVGSGLGLAIVKALCDAMGAAVWAEASPAGGLAVHLVLPAPAGPTSAARPGG
jgi:two-component system OmpR family sensor kinase